MIKKLGSNCNIRSTSFIPVIMSSHFLEKKDLNIYNRCSHKSYQKHIYLKKYPDVWIKSFILQQLKIT